MQYSKIPTKFPIPFGANAGGGFINPIPQASQIGIQAGRASLTDGFPPLNFIPTGAGGTPPFGQDMNGILNQITLWTQWQNAGGLTKYDSNFSTAIGGYPFGALLASTTAGGCWLCTADNNTSNPDTGGANWVQIGSGVSSGISTGTDSGSANVMTGTVSPVPTANNGAMTGNINALGSHPIVMPDGGAMVAGAWPANGAGVLVWNQASTSLILTNPSATALSGGGLTATAEQVFSLNIPGLPAPVGSPSLSDLFAVHSIADGKPVKQTVAAIAAEIFSLLGQSLGTSGYQVLPGGLILQWLLGPNDPANTTEPTHTLSWPLAFPNNCFGALISSAVNSVSAGADFNYMLNNQPSQTQVAYYRNWQPGGSIPVTTFPFIWGIGN